MGKLRSLQRPDESLIQYDYDLNGSMTVLTNPMSVTNTFGYTANKQRNTWTTPLSGSYQYTYDKERKLKTITFPSGKQISNTYAHGLLTSTTTPEGAISYTYNNDFKLSAMVYSGATQSFKYDNDGLLISAGIYAITRNAQNGLPEIVSDGTMSIKRMFSGYGELDEGIYTVNGTPLYDWTVTRDAAGRIVQKIEYIQDTAMIWDYGYDELGRLTIWISAQLERGTRWYADTNTFFRFKADYLPRCVSC